MDDNKWTKKSGTGTQTGTGTKGSQALKIGMQKDKGVGVYDLEYQ